MSDSFPLVSIVTPSYNQAAFLRATIESVLAQDYPRLEYIVIDGGSTDGSGEIIQRYADRLADWVSERDGGQSDAINKGWARARGEIVAWLNSDDTYLPNAISTSVKFLQTHPDVDLVYADCPLINEQGTEIGKLRAEPFDLQKFLTVNTIPQSTVFMRRRILEKIGRLNVEWRYAMDYDYWLRAALHFNLRKLPAATATYRWHGESKFISKPDQFLFEYSEILKRAFEDPAFPPALLPRRERALGTHHVRWALYCFTAGLDTQGQTMLGSALTEYAFLRNDADALLDMLAYHLVNVAERSVESNARWLDTLYKSASPLTAPYLPAKSRVLARAHLIRGFTAFQDANVHDARRELWSAVRREPSFLKNRGVLSILLKPRFLQSPRTV